MRRQPQMQATPKWILHPLTSKVESTTLNPQGIFNSLDVIHCCLFDKRQWKMDNHTWFVFTLFSLFLINEPLLHGIFLISILFYRFYRHRWSIWATLELRGTSQLIAVFRNKKPDRTKVVFLKTRSNRVQLEPLNQKQGTGKNWSKPIKPGSWTSWIHH